MNKIKNESREEIQRILEERARILARQTTEQEGEVLHLVTFKLGEERYGVETILVHEIQPLKKQGWALVPCTPEFIVGAVNIRGRIYSVMDVGYFLGLASRPLTETAHVLLVRGGGQRSGEEMELCILVDDLPVSSKVPLTEIQPPSTVVSIQSQEYVRGVTEDMLGILDLERLLSEPGIIVQEEV